MSGAWYVLSRFLIGISILVSLCAIWYLLGLLIAALVARFMTQRRSETQAGSAGRETISSRDSDGAQRVSDRQNNGTTGAHSRRTVHRCCKCGTGAVTREELSALCPTFLYSSSSAKAALEKLGDIDDAGEFKGKESESEEFVCAICLDVVGDGDTVKRLPCDHLFHSRCISKWVRRTNRCPLCNTQVKTSGSTAPEITNTNSISSRSRNDAVGIINNDHDARRTEAEIDLESGPAPGESTAEFVAVGTYSPPLPEQTTGTQEIAPVPVSLGDEERTEQNTALVEVLCVR
mmetsp:Transcript_8069/g.17365  ORF Transcript_8069/g.17365 Transcript_8069/m.17365 type:complete len:290 (+) Transcript_8069:164-1033(+)